MVSSDIKWAEVQGNAFVSSSRILPAKSLGTCWLDHLRRSVQNPTANHRSAERIII